MAKSGPPKVHRYRMHFKATAVRLSELPDVLIQDVAEALDIHPFMLSRWRKQAREGFIVTKGVKLDDETVAELKRLRELEKKYKLLQQEQPCCSYFLSSRISGAWGISERRPIMFFAPSFAGAKGSRVVVCRPGIRGLRRAAVSMRRDAKPQKYRWGMSLEIGNNIDRNFRRTDNQSGQSRINIRCHAAWKPIASSSTPHSPRVVPIHFPLPRALVSAESDRSS